MKNVVFDLGGVVFARDPRKFEPEFIKFFSYIMLPEMPHFWEEYDRGVSTYEQVLSDLAEYNSCDRELADRNLKRSILTQEEIPATKTLIEDLKLAQYKLYVLSNMSLEFIEFLRKKDVYKNFDGEVVSCEEHIVKPDAEIYRCLTTRYGLDVAETLFIDDRQQNVDAARNEGWLGFKFDPRNPEASCQELRDILLKK
ncbi:MAG: HAD family phosphatase [Alistipes sp.]|nr:HAD family phosphatase [Alistipes sp.]